ncbi:MAG: chalcone isomerase family protein [Nitrospirota bacterium]|nr:MAG: chalcone isomerase family protein [Nitrospirota bacterium]
MSITSIRRVMELTVILFIILSITSMSEAVKRGGVEMPDTLNIDGRSLVLNGVGIREATAFKVKVYVMGLYLETKDNDPGSIIASTGSKRILMTFSRNVGEGKLNNGWEDGFTKNFREHQSIRKEIDIFKSAMRSIKKGESIVIDILGSDTYVRINEEERAVINGEMFQRALLSIWLGPYPPNEGLKEGILGR